MSIARNVHSALWPANGLRHTEEDDTSGWYIPAREDLPDDDDFFAPLHVEHLRQWRPQVLPYLELPPGWRFLIAPGYEDVWFDKDLLK